MERRGLSPAPAPLCRLRRHLPRFAGESLRFALEAEARRNPLPAKRGRAGRGWWERRESWAASLRPPLSASPTSPPLRGREFALRLRARGSHRRSGTLSREAGRAGRGWWSAGVLALPLRPLCRLRHLPRVAGESLRCALESEAAITAAEPSPAKRGGQGGGGRAPEPGGCPGAPSVGCADISPAARERVCAQALEPEADVFDVEIVLDPVFGAFRPMPDSLTPPKGATSVVIRPSLMPTMPYFSASATRKARPRSRV